MKRTTRRRLGLALIVAGLIAIMGGCSNAITPGLYSAPHKTQRITLEVTGTENSSGLWSEGQRLTHSVTGPFKITLPLKLSVYAITESLQAKAAKNGNIVTPGHLTARILIDGKVVVQETTGPDSVMVNIAVYRNADGSYYTVQ